MISHRLGDVHLSVHLCMTSQGLSQQNLVDVSVDVSKFESNEAKLDEISFHTAVMTKMADFAQGEMTQWAISLKTISIL